MPPSPHEDSIAQFGQGCTALRDQLENDADLSHIEQLFIENCVTMIELVYVAWKHRKDPASLTPPPSNLLSSSGESSGESSGASQPTIDA